jgi:PPP family 3-phenylpropionic acid transporter
MPASFSAAFSLPARLGSFYFAYFAYVAAFVAYLPLYLASRGLDAGEIAFVLALPQLARIFAPSAWGWLADRTGARRGIVAFSCAVIAVCFLSLPWMEGMAGLAWSIALMSLLSAGALPLVEAISLASFAASPGRYGPVRLWGSVGFIAVVLAGGAWLDVGPVARLPAILAACAIASLAVAVSLPAGASPAKHAEAKPASSSRAVRALFGSGFCMSAAHGALYAFFTLHLQGEGYSGTAIGVFWTLGVAAEIAVFAYLPALFRRYALSAILIFSFACAVVRFLAIGWWAGVPWLLVPAQLLHGATFGLFHAASVAAVQRVFPEGAQGRGQTLFSSVAYGAGGAAGMLLAGWGWETAGPGLAFSLAALAGLAGAYFAYAVRRAGL